MRDDRRAGGPAVAVLQKVLMSPLVRRIVEREVTPPGSGPFWGVYICLCPRGNGTAEENEAGPEITEARDGLKESWRGPDRGAGS
jgi:hypothetical protein